MECKEHEESYQERQSNEFTILQSMFPGDIKDLRPITDEVHSPTDFIITLAPQESPNPLKNPDVKVDFRVTCLVTYPDTIPAISLENVRGISNQATAQLKEELITLAKKLTGEVMILELIQHVQTFLCQHNTPRYASFYEEMMSNQKRVEEEQMKDRQRKDALIKISEAQQRKAILDEMIRKQSALEEESHWKKRRSLNTDQNLDEISDARLKTVSRTQRQMIPKTNTVACTPLEKVCDHKGTCVLQFSNRHPRKIQRGKCLGHKYNDTLIMYSGMDLNTGDYLTISEWIFKCPSSVRKPKSKIFQTGDSGILKQLATLEQELAFLCKVKHSNLVQYIDMKTYQDKEGTVWCLVLQELVLGQTLAYHFAQNLPVEYQRLQHYMLGILQALSFLHKKSIIHRDLKDTNVFIDNSGIVRVAGYSLEKRLLDLYCSLSKENLEPRFPSSIGRGGKKGDIFRLGILGLSLAQGEIVTSSDPDIPETFPILIQDFLQKCLSKLEEDRWSADELLNHSFVKPSFIQQDSDYISPDRCFDKEEHNGIMNDPHITESKFSQLLPKESSNYQSRLRDEFEIIGFIGKGGFGSVFKARNKLDRGIYAIKCIRLNPSNKQLNRKITREVKLLSRLNHENVIRYYNSWLETGCLEVATNSRPNSNCDGVSLDEASQEQNKSKPSLKLGESFIWNGSFNYKKSEEFDCSSSEEDEDIFGTSLLHYSDVSESIIFENSTTNATTPHQKSTDICLTGKERLDALTSDASKDGSNIVQLMYIQMEFCDKNTLLDAIANDLYKDEERVWRLFREIVEGLAHIHQQGMIHRDLKPGNIFIDAQNHVKIGDFGLATNIVCDSHIISKIQAAEIIDHTLQSDDIDANNETGMVGTALYIAPEVQMQAPNAAYNQKIDIYSLGIIFFEMCSPPLNTSMERCKVLSNLRRHEIIFPSEFNEKTKSQQMNIIRWLLNHESGKRPSSQELLQSKYLPPPQMEEAELQEMLRHTISNPQCKAYKHMISSLLKQESTTAANVTYDIDIHKGSYSNKVALTQKFANDTLLKIFKKHGAIPVNISFLMPKSSLYEKDDMCVHLVDHGGGVVSLPYDLRVPFARFVVKNNVTFLKRYHISPVYRENKVFGCHPRTLYECAFDIVTPDPGRLITDAEVIIVINEIFYEFPVLQNHRSIIRLNHTSILKGILMACGLQEDKHSDVYCVLLDAKANNLNQNQLLMRLGTLNLSEHMAGTLCKLLSKEGSPQQISSHLKCTLKRGEARNIIMQGISELETVICNAKSMGLTTTIVVTLNLILRNMHHFSGPVFQYVCELKKKQKKERLDVLAAGGRYDQLIAKTRAMMDISGNKDVAQSGVGVSIAVEKLVAALLECKDFNPPGAFDVLICALGSNASMKERIKISRELWNVGVSAHMLDDTLQSLEEIQELCKSYFATQMIILKDTEVGICRVRWWDRDRYCERKVPTAEISDYMFKKLTISKSKVDVSESGNESSMMTNIKRCSITFTTNEKCPSILRKRYEGQIMSNLNYILESFSSKVQVCILAVELKSQVLKELAAHIKLDGNENDFQQSVRKVIEHHQRHRKYVGKVCDEIFKMMSEQKKPVIIIYGLHDSSYTVVM